MIASPDSGPSAGHVGGGGTITNCMSVISMQQRVTKVVLKLLDAIIDGTNSRSIVSGLVKGGISSPQNLCSCPQGRMPVAMQATVIGNASDVWIFHDTKLLRRTI